MSENFVEYKGKKYKAKIKKNNLSLKLAKKKIVNILDIKGIDSIADLQILEINNNQIKVIEGLENLSKLHTLYLYHNSISEIKGLDSLKELRRLDLTHNQINKISGLETLKNLERLDLGYNQISEITGLEKLGSLKVISLGNNNITDIKGLDKNPNLETILLNDNHVTEITGLENQKKLKKLCLNNNPIDNSIMEGLGGLISGYNYDNSYFGISLLPSAETYYLRDPQRVVEYCKKQLENRQKNIKEEKGRLQQRNQEIIEKIHKIMKVSSRVRLDMMRNILELDAKTFDNKILDWAVEFNFKIDGDFIVIENADIDGFITGLDRQFDRWKNAEKSSSGKI